MPISILKEMGARLASNGAILCREKIPYNAIQAIFELDGARGMGPRIQSPSLVDEYVCETMDGEDCVQASERYIMKVAEQYKDDLAIPFTFRNNVSLALQKVQGGQPTEAQAKEIVNHVTRAIVDSSPKFECSCRWCPWCLNVVRASIIRCLFCNAQMVSVGRFMDQSSLGKPRALDSAIVIDIAEESIADIDVVVEPEFEEPEDEARAAQEEQAQVDTDIEAIFGDDTLMDAETAIDEYGEKEDFAEEDLTISNDVAKEPAAICINTEEIGEILDDYLSLSFTEKKAKVDEYHTPVAKRQFFCPANFDPDTKLPRAPTKEE